MLNISPALLVSRVITLLVAFTCHEFSHALVAVLLGDNTPKRDGRLSFNPLRHLDPWGCILLILVGFGYAKPVRVNPYAVTRKTKAGMMLVAAAGPLANVQPFGVSWLHRPAYFLNQFIWTNLSLLVFNLVPLYPLDGEKVVGYFIPQSFRRSWQLIQSHGSQILIICFFLLPYLRINFARDFVSNVTYSLYRLLLGG